MNRCNNEVELRKDLVFIIQRTIVQDITFNTFKNFEGQGIGTEICRQLVLLSLKTDPSIRITARTLIENNASTIILKRNGFEFVGTVYDDEDGDVWEWEYRNNSTR